MQTSQIINTYDAARVKRRTCYLTPMEPELIPIGVVHHYPNESRNIDKTVITYNGSFARTTMLSEGTAYQHDLSVHNPEGYTHFDIAGGKLTNPQQYYFRRDHLGSNVAVWNATRDTTVQRTWYYASGTPMSNSTGQSAQSYKYNGKEFVEIFGNNTYDYGFRGYHAITGRFTTMDPLTERIPWQSPYTYANNNWINLIDWKGLSGFSSMHTSNAYPQSYNYIVIDRNGYFLGGVDDDDNHIYMSEDSEWDEKKGKKGLKEVGLMIFNFSTYMDMALSSGLNFRVPGIYYGQNSIEISTRIGLIIQKSISTPIKKKPFDKISLSINLMSYDIFNTSIPLGEKANFKFFGKEGKATISNGISVAFWGIEQTFDIRLKDCAYICGSNNVTISPIEKEGETGYTISFSGGLFITYSFTLHFDLFYESK